MTNPDHWVTLQAPGATTRLLSAITEHGLVFIDGIHDPARLLHFTGTFATVVHHRDSAADGITTIIDLRTSPRSGRAAFTSHALVPHTDGTGVVNPPALLLMACAHPASTGGHSLLVDGHAVHDDLARTAPEALTAFYTPRSALFGGATGQLSSVFSAAGNGRVRIRWRIDELARFSPQTARHIPALRGAIDRHTVALQLRPGQGYALDNHRWLHGRRAFTGPRVMHRVIANPLPHHQILTGFNPTLPTPRHGAA